MSSEQVLKLVLRVMGSSSLLGLIFVVAPFGWMDSIHQGLGMGPLSDDPVVGYVARSTSALYALIGGLLWVVSFDPGRHRRVLIYLGAAVTVFGAALLVVDWVEGLPLAWKLWEGPFVMVFGLTMLFLSRGLAPSTSSSTPVPE